MTKEEFIERWDALPIERRFIMNLFMTGKCFQCKKIVAPPAIALRGEYAYHFHQTHGIYKDILINILNNYWNGKTS